VAVEKNFTGDSQNVLRARSASVGGWEQFNLLTTRSFNAGLSSPR
jgi:hypothetical protein